MQFEGVLRPPRLPVSGVQGGPVAYYDCITLRLVHTCVSPASSWRGSSRGSIRVRSRTRQWEHMQQLLLGVLQAFTPENLEFQKKVLERSGLGEETYLPECE